MLFLHCNEFIMITVAAPIEHWHFINFQSIQGGIIFKFSPFLPQQRLKKLAINDQNDPKNLENNLLC